MVIPYFRFLVIDMSSQDVTPNVFDSNDPSTELVICSKSDTLKIGKNLIAFFIKGL